MYANFKIPGILLPVSVYTCFDAIKSENYKKLPLHIEELEMLVFLHVHLAAFAQKSGNLA